MPKVRELKFHEQKLLKKVDFLNWKSDNIKEEYRVYMLKMIHKYKLRDQKEFFNYQRIATITNEAVQSIRDLPDKEYLAFKKEQFELLSVKLYQMGVLDSVDELDRLNKLTVGRFCRRRVSYLLKVMHFAETVTYANDYIRHGHVRIGPNVVNDPAFLVPRNLEDFITWTNDSSIKKTIKNFNEDYDAYEMLDC
ncbi:U3 small nucleolar ribonucleoprotein IMP3 [Acrasis kona]|uniref:U3 small nucleolar ribonucleoprotein IMP3 n=1 Tax=Acrasis kona TaxID=1008807 RepID=A0AAW2ZM29_9EUKA